MEPNVWVCLGPEWRDVDLGVCVAVTGALRRRRAVLKGQCYDKKECRCDGCAEETKEVKGQCCDRKVRLCMKFVLRLEG
ncbi:hypothetical protein E2C01_037399 [Portunus trituberculatus]|uniref:Uncharacterized protein n=1 Tax=Portunus trituberculatus TaxID=210409 RepID=A0A5B7FDW4_PORTR|nr:hypothetical protein [Portunus trituberculatus]